MVAWLLESPDLRRRNSGPEGVIGELLGPRPRAPALSDENEAEMGSNIQKTSGASDESGQVAYRKKKAGQGRARTRAFFFGN